MNHSDGRFKNQAIEAKKMYCNLSATVIHENELQIQWGALKEASVGESLELNSE